jgi:outer membrane lipoprotein carrier protein
MANYRIVTRLCAFFLVTLVLVSTAGTAQSAGPENELVKKIQTTYDGLKAFETKFKQNLKNVGAGDSEERVGTIHFKKPKLIRWETVSPSKELLVVGAKEVWDYFEEDKIAYKYTVESILNSKTMLKFISGQARLDEDFTVTRDKAESAKGVVKLNLAPKDPEPQLVSAAVWVDPNSGLFQRILLQDFYGNQNELRFEETKVNPALADALFTYTPGKGVEIFDNTKEPAGQGKKP